MHPVIADQVVCIYSIIEKVIKSAEKNVFALGSRCR